LFLGVAAAADPDHLDLIARAGFWYDHGAALMLMSADLITLVILLIVTMLHRAKFTRLRISIESNRLEVKRLGGVAEERKSMLDRVERHIQTLKERTMQLRACDEDHERRVMYLENKLNLAHDRAVARLALRGDAWKDDLAANPDNFMPKTP
jgi:hypothetical protein